MIFKIHFFFQNGSCGREIELTVTQTAGLSFVPGPIFLCGSSCSVLLRVAVAVAVAVAIAGLEPMVWELGHFDEQIETVQ